MYLTRIPNSPKASTRFPESLILASVPKESPASTGRLHVPAIGAHFFPHLVTYMYMYFNVLESSQEEERP